MIDFTRFRRLSVAAALLLAFPAAALAQEPQQLPGPVAGDVTESYHLLVTSFFKQVDPQSLVDAARSALTEEARKNGARVAVAPIHASDDDDQTAQDLDQAIADTAKAAHGAPADYAYAAIAGMAQSVDDRWTQFMNPDDFKKFNDALDPEKISGIGVLIDQDAQSQLIRASYVVPGTPADKAGLRSGDIFVSIDGTSTKGLNQENASKLLRGKAGTIVHLMVTSGATDAARDVAITRSEVQPPTVIFKMLPGNIGYVYVLAFGKDTPTEFDTAIERLNASSARALVLDLRNDGGGYVQSALEISSRFIANKPLVTVEQRGQDAQTIQAEDDTRVNVPVTVLVNGFTASASEITAGALQDDGIGILVGTKTFGKGVMQTLTPLPDGSAIKITTAHYLTPRHRDINLRGIDPDVKVADATKDTRFIFGEVDKDAQLRAAVELLQRKIAEAPSKPGP